MSLIHHDQVDEAYFSEELLAEFFVAESLHRDHSPEPVSTWVAADFLQVFFQVLACGDVKIPATLPAHFITPFVAKPGRADNQIAIEHLTSLQLGQDQGGFDRFAKTHLVCNEEPTICGFKDLEQRLVLKRLKQNSLGPKGIHRALVCVEYSLNDKG